MTPRIFFCTTCKNRAEYLKQTLPSNLAGNRYAKTLLLNYNSQDDLEDYIKDKQERDVEAGRLIVYRFTEPGPFRMAHAKNLAHRLALREGADLLVNMDADNFAGEHFDKYVAEQFHRGSRQFLWGRMIKDGSMTRGITGRIAVTRAGFLLAGGYDEKYCTWSPDDKDFNARLRGLGYRPEEIPRKFLNALPHNQKVRFKEYPHAKCSDKDYYDDPNYKPSHLIANAGRVGCGVVYRNFGRDPVEVTPIATRVFGIGMHKTATTSLHGAFGILGYDSAHWTTAHWAKAIWEEVKQKGPFVRLDGRSPTLEKHYAICDLPIPLLYRELDEIYPGSKFILTIREEKDWLESVRNHWTHNNRYRKQWDNDPFTHKVHRELYGQKWFDPEVMVNRYRHHNTEVREYFKDRPQDLLVMDMSKETTGWYELCGFLNERIPEAPYPHHFASKFGHGGGI